MTIDIRHDNANYAANIYYLYSYKLYIRIAHFISFHFIYYFSISIKTTAHIRKQLDMIPRSIIIVETSVFLIQNDGADTPRSKNLASALLFKQANLMKWH